MSVTSVGKLLRENGLLLQVLESMADAVIVSDINGKIVFWNQSSVRDFGYSSEEAIGNTISIIAPGGTKDVTLKEVANLNTPGASARMVVARKTKDGRSIWVSLMMSVLVDANNVPAFYLGISKEVTLDMESQNRLNILETTLQTVSEGILISATPDNAEEYVLFANGAFRELTEIGQQNLGLDPVTLLQKLFPEWSLKDEHSESISQSEVRLFRDGHDRWFNIVVVPVLVGQDIVSHRLYMIRDITFRKQMMEQLQVQNTELKNSQQQLDQMIYGVSHDLRSPLNSILGLTSLMRKEKYGQEAAIYLDKIASSVMRLNEFTLNIIQYSKNNSKVPLLQKIDFGELFNISADLHRYTEAGQRIAFQYVNSEKVYIRSDRDRWQTIFNNLIGNCIKFSRQIQNSLVKVAVSRNANFIFVSFEDNGTGIEKERLASVFDMFYRADTIRSGSGLGLFIVKQCVEALGGEIGVESQVNSMTKFTITLPISVLYHDSESN